jgi:hypothetical protein
MEGLLKRLHRGVHRMWSDTSTRAQVLCLPVVASLDEIGRRNGPMCSKMQPCGMSGTSAQRTAVLQACLLLALIAHSVSHCMIPCCPFQTGAARHRLHRVHHGEGERVREPAAAGRGAGHPVLHRGRRAAHGAAFVTRGISLLGFAAAQLASGPVPAMSAVSLLALDQQQFARLEAAMVLKIIAWCSVHCIPTKHQCIPSQVGDEKRGPVLELLLTKLRFVAATHAAAAAGEAGVEPLPDFTGQLQVGTLAHPCASCFRPCIASHFAAPAWSCSISTGVTEMCWP